MVMVWCLCGRDGPAGMHQAEGEIVAGGKAALPAAGLSPALNLRADHQVHESGAGKPAAIEPPAVDAACFAQPRNLDAGKHHLLPGNQHPVCIDDLGPAFDGAWLSQGRRGAE